jgi:natural product biosynthesis luciferase-like monooxygenase protein
LLPLITGATVQVIPRDVARDPSELCQLIHDSGVSHIVLVPTLLAAIASHLQATGDNLPSLRYCVSSGEPLPLELANRFRSVLPHVELTNIYGTTEFWDATSYTVRAFEPRSTVPIGLPMPGMGLYLLDEHQRPVPPGVDGELYVTSPGMGPGYVGRPELTASVFLPCPFEPGRLMYRTGDRARWQAGVGLEYLGRTDRQLNVHGFRIEPSEIEAAMAKHPDVAEAVVMARGEDKHLAGYIVPRSHEQAATMPFGLFYFSDAANAGDTDEMALYIESVKAADRLGFEAVWTPERHFTKVGASFPNPSVLSAAAAMVTQHVQLRSGSIVLPLHEPLRVAEEWAVVDRLSGGRVALSFASGWVPNDFVLAPDNFADRHQVMLKGIEEVRTLWRGGTVSRRNGVGAMVEVGVQPRPVQAELPTWVTAAGAPQTFIDAGRIGANVLTHVLNTTIGGLGEKIAAYRKARKEAGYDPATGKVAVMVHTYVTDDAATAVKQARPHLENYFRSQLKLRKDVGAALGLEVDTDQDLSDEVITLAVDRFLATKGLVGSPESCQPLVRELYEGGVDEIACLIDFGVPAAQILANLPALDRLRRSATRGVRASDVTTWLQTRLPAHMVPQSVTVLDKLPLTPNGKIDRLALPDPVGGRAMAGHVAPRNRVEAELAAIWAEVLRRESVGINDRFFELGGNSVTAIRMINRAQKALGIKISVRELFEKQTIAALELGKSRSPVQASTPMMQLSHAPNAPTLFCIHGGTGEASYYAKLSRQLGDCASVYAIQYPALVPAPAQFDTLADLARAYIQMIKQVQPHGPYRLLGWSFGGLAAYEIARQLTAVGEEVSFLCMLDALIATGEPPQEKWSDAQALFYLLKIHDLVRDAEEAAELERTAASETDGQRLLQRALEHLKQRQVYPDSACVDDLARNLASIRDVIHMSMHFRPDRYSGNVLYVGAMDDDHNVDEVVARWTSLIDGDIDLLKVNMRHNRMFDDAHVGQISVIVKQRLAPVGEALPG